MKNRRAYSKPVSELSGYRTFVAPTSTESSKPRDPVLPLRTEDDKESHEIDLGLTYENKPGPVGGTRKLWRTFGKPGEEYGAPWKDFNQRRTITSSDVPGLNMNRERLLKTIVSEIKDLTPEEMYEEALKIKGESQEDWEDKDEVLLEKLRKIVYDEVEEVEEEQEEDFPEGSWGEDYEEDWSEDLPGDVLSYTRRTKRQKSHSRAERNKRYRAMGAMGRIKARQYAKRYRRTRKSQLSTTRKQRKNVNRSRLGPRVKTRRRASEELSPIDRIRISYHMEGTLEEQDLQRLQRHGYRSERENLGACPEDENKQNG